MDTMQRNYSYNRSDSDQSIELFDEAGLYDQESQRQWEQNVLFDDSLVLPPNVANLHDKHDLYPAETEGHDAKRQEMTLDSGKKKPGRKPILNEPTTKRKAQNRAAQRAFRERKENHVKDLETRVAELEQQSNSQSLENQRLRAELARLRGTSVDDSFGGSHEFNFDFAALPSVPRRDLAGSTRDSLSAPSDCPSLSSSSNSPLTSTDKDFNAAAIPFFSRGSSDPGSNSTATDSGISTTSPTKATSQLFSSPKAVFENAVFDSSVFSSAPFMNQPLSHNFNALDYRETSIFDSFDVDPPLFDTTESDLLPETDHGALDSFFAPTLQSNEPGTSTKNELRTIAPADADTASSGAGQPTRVEDWSPQKPDDTCPELWRRVVSHPKFATFDLDELCTEFSKKNKCTAAEFEKELTHTAKWEMFDQQLDNFAERQGKITA